MDPQHPQVLRPGPPVQRLDTWHLASSADWSRTSSPLSPPPVPASPSMASLRYARSATDLRSTASHGRPSTAVSRSPNQGSEGYIARWDAHADAWSPTVPPPPYQELGSSTLTVGRGYGAAYSGERPSTAVSHDGGNDDRWARPEVSSDQARPSTATRSQERSATRRKALPVDARIIDAGSTPGGLSPLSPTAPEIRRVKSSSALSTSLESETSSTATATTTETQTVQDKLKVALAEAQYFAGGLISHPVESTRHYSIIRHSGALVWYSGPATSISITILSDGDLPLDRTVWLQQKGFSGNMGMAVKALMGTKGDWLDVTPATRAAPEHIPSVEERGIQRDLKRFAKKATGRLRKHVPVETHVIRVPATAVDGYFRLVLCTGEGGKKTLCGSPVFRVASTTTELSVVRGASLKTMPLEVGVKVASTVGQQVVKRYAGAAALVVQNRATSTVTKKVSNVAMNNARKAFTTGKQVVQTTGMDSAVVDSWERGKNGRYEVAVFESVTSLVGPDEGPEAPFPVSFEGRVGRASGQSTRELGLPTANVHGVRDEVKMRMTGVYAAWACVRAPRSMGADISADWHQAIVCIGPLRYGPPEVVVKNRVAVHLLHDFDGVSFVDAKLRVILMGYLHPPLQRDAPPSEVLDQHATDAMVVMASLGRDNWSVEQASSQDRTLSDRLDGVTGSVQGKVDRIPLHWVGVRSEIGVMRDKMYGNGGLWIPRR